jgi:hypothetical protein
VSGVDRRGGGAEGRRGGGRRRPSNSRDDAADKEPKERPLCTSMWVRLAGLESVPPGPRSRGGGRGEIKERRVSLNNFDHTSRQRQYTTGV